MTDHTRVANPYLSAERIEHYRELLLAPGWTPLAVREINALCDMALRYAWLRERPSLIGWDWWPGGAIPGDVNITPEFLDEAIDAQQKDVGGINQVSKGR